jgi:hypothetical protein
VSRRSNNPVGDFNTAGQDKCPHCSDYKPSAWILSHINSCDKNPANQTPPPTKEST